MFSETLEWLKSLIPMLESITLGDVVKDVIIALIVIMIIQFLPWVCKQGYRVAIDWYSFSRRRRIEKFCYQLLKAYHNEWHLKKLELSVMIVNIFMIISVIIICSLNNIGINFEILEMMEVDLELFIIITKYMNIVMMYAITLSTIFLFRLLYLYVTCLHRVYRYKARKLRQQKRKQLKP